MLAKEFTYYVLYLYFEHFFNYEESEQITFVDGIMDNLSGHIKFDSIKVKEAP